MIKTWKRGDKRAVHKPLLLLLALGAYKNNRSLNWEIVDRELGRLLKQFGGANPKGTVYPFIRLQNDGYWTVQGFEHQKGDARVTELHKINPTASLSPNLVSELAADPDKLQTLTNQILNDYFAHSMKEDILESVGLAPSQTEHTSARRKRHPEFKNAVLNAYDRKCAICGYGARMDEISVGIEAAHIKWHAYSGPDKLNNGIALCSLHHKLFDRGAFALDNNYRLIPSKQLNGPGIDQAIFRHANQTIKLPRQVDDYPLMEYLHWQRSEVFKG